MKKNLISSAIAVIVFTVLLGIAYPLVMTGVSQVVFPSKADGSPIKVDGRTIGSKLLGQAYQVPVLDKNGKPEKDSDGNPVTQPNPKYFQPRPSQDDYNPNGTFFSNRGPNQASAKFFYRDQIAAYLKLESPYDPGLKTADIPQDAVTTSASGVDPHISKANAAIQAHRIAAVRKLPLARVQALVKANTDGRSLGFLGEPGVNVTELNLALDREAR
jgi:potassium-transporting ATPase KdpC subunit